MLGIILDATSRVMAADQRSPTALSQSTAVGAVATSMSATKVALHRPDLRHLGLRPITIVLEVMVPSRDTLKRPWLCEVMTVNVLRKTGEQV
jgi:hypothetical protein